MLPCLHAWSVRRGLGQFLRLFLLRRLNIGARRGGRDGAGKLFGPKATLTRPPSLPGLTWLDPAIHHFWKMFLTKEMDARVKPAHDDKGEPALQRPRGMCM